MDENSLNLRHWLIFHPMFNHKETNVLLGVKIIVKLNQLPSGIEPETVHELTGKMLYPFTTETGLSKHQLSQLALPSVARASTRLADSFWFNS